jgi:hypothetical protein
MMQPYIKELSLNCNYDDICRHILEVAQKIKNYTLVSESKTLNRYIIKDTGINIEINLQKVSDNVTNLKILTKSDREKYFSAEQTVVDIISRFEKALAASIEGKLEEYKHDKANIDSGGCLGVVIIIVAIIMIIFVLFALFSS